MKKPILFLSMLLPITLLAQSNVMTPELLWSLSRLSVTGVSPNNQTLIYSVKTFNLKTEKSKDAYYFLNLKNNASTPTTIFGKKIFVQWDKNGLYAREGEKLFKSIDEGKSWKVISSVLKDAVDVRISPDGEWVAFSKPVLVEKVLGKEIYPEYNKSTAQIYTDLNYRHWDRWSNGTVSHVFVASLHDPRNPAKDILGKEPYDCPQKPFGVKEDFMFSPDSKSVIYVCKKKTGKEYAQSTNTDIYEYSIADAATIDLTEGMMGYDVSPAYSPDGSKLAWLSMKTDGYESDKNDLIVMDLNTKKKSNLTASWDETIDGSFIWANDNQSIYFSSSLKGTQQLFQVNVSAAEKNGDVKQITSGNFDVTDLWVQEGNSIIAGRTDFNHATELYKISLDNGTMAAITHVNDNAYSKIKMGTSKMQMVTTQDGHQMGVWVIYPPDFNPTKKYPTLLYCQGGPQDALSQFYSFRWNFQLMAANGYIIVAPNRRGMPGWGVAWNASISKDWGGKPIQDYLDAIDALSKEPYVDKNNLGCVGASYGGYSVYELAGVHNNRFKTFIAHDGLFDLKSWYGTTEELWFANWDIGGNYWQKPVPESYQKFNPSNFVDKWNTPIMIIQGGIDYRVPVGQGLEAFQAAQLRGIKSKLFYCPNENHWVLHPHNALVWQHEFFKWLKETI
ncbi:MAG TPA: S9 family peptidase [Hanamia sp.]|nr:S9 family peptidase [Hanamia sp.]